MTRLISFVGGTALAAAALLACGPAAFAQHHGGGGMGGGGHMGGGGFGGGYHGGYGGGYRGGYGGYRGGYYGGGYRGYGGYGYGWGYPGFGLFLGLGGYGYGYGYGPDYYSPTIVTAGADTTYGVQTQSAYTPNTSDTARLDIRVPADAQVWVGDVPLQQTGELRQMISPPGLEAGKVYHYSVKATWTANGQPVTEERKINVQAGLASLVDFTKPADATSNTMPAPVPSPAPTPRPANPAPTTPPAKTPPVDAARAG